MLRQMLRRVGGGRLQVREHFRYRLIPLARFLAKSFADDAL
jgi:hypothetical protein